MNAKVHCQLLVLLVLLAVSAAASERAWHAEDDTFRYEVREFPFALGEPTVRVVVQMWIKTRPLPRVDAVRVTLRYRDAAGVVWRDQRTVKAWDQVGFRFPTATEPFIMPAPVDVLSVDAAPVVWRAVRESEAVEQ